MQVLMESVRDAETIVKNPQHFLIQTDLAKIMQDLSGAVKTVYPMGLPEYDPVRMELENREILSECHDAQLVKVRH
jgi:hypothetical protein